MKKTIFTACIISLIQTTSFAQNKHKVSLMIGSEQPIHLVSKGLHMSDLISQLSLGYEYHLHPKISIYGHYIRWLNIHWGNSSISGLPKEEQGKRSVLPKSEYDYDKIIYQQNYHFINIGASYAFFQKKGHQIRGKGGLIMAFGKDSYLEDIYPHPNNTNDLQLDFYYEKTFTKQASHLGANIGLDYNYQIFKNFSVGVMTTYDFYFSESPSRLSYGLQIGYHF